MVNRLDSIKLTIASLTDIELVMRHNICPYRLTFDISLIKDLLLAVGSECFDIEMSDTEIDRYTLNIINYYKGFFYAR